MKETKKYWKGLEELNNTDSFQELANKEFPEYIPVKESSSKGDAKDASRRDFLKLMGFSVAAASLAACETPVKSVIPYVNKPENLEPGTANYYASSYINGSDYASVLVKTREGRPIHIAGNDLSPINKGAASTTAMAALLSLYDSNRIKNFTKGGEKIAKADADKEIISALKSAKNIRIVSQTILSPSTKAVINDFVNAYPGTKHVAYDPVSAYGLTEANGGNVPNYQFDKADVIVSFDADFTGSWINSTEYARAYAETRKVREGKDKKNDMSKHYHFETSLTITGSCADKRVGVKPSELPYFVATLYNKIASASGANQVDIPEISDERKAMIEAAAKDLLSNKGKGLVVSGSNDVAVQTLVAKINEIIGSNGSTIDNDRPAYFKQGNDDQMIGFIEDLEAGNVDAVIFYNANPVYDHPYASKIAKGLSKIALSVSLGLTPDETTKECKYVCPDYHVYESWNDAEPKKGLYSIAQPAISPLFNNKSKGWETRAAQESLLVWSGSSTNWFDYLKSQWKSNLFEKQGKELVFESFWFNVVQNGVYELNAEQAVEQLITESEAPVDSTVVPVIADAISDTTGIDLPLEESVSESVTQDENIDLSLSEIAKRIKHFYKASDGFEIALYVNNSVGNGAMANNPWLQEMPDPISKVTWDNYVAISMSDAAELGLNLNDENEGRVDIVEVVVKGVAQAKLPVLIQPGQAKGTLSVALGYGRKAAGPLAAGIKEENKITSDAIGVDMYPFVTIAQSALNFSCSGAKLNVTGKSYRLAQTQTHQTLMARPIILEAGLSDYKKDPTAALQDADYRKITRLHTTKGEQHPSEIDLWKAPKSDSKDNYEGYKSDEVLTHEYANHHWGLVIDLNACNGCSACMVACQSENNIPVVGKDEVLRRREMHWLRIDRYYSTDADTSNDNRNISGYKEMEVPSENPEVVFQPMMCQHCNHAPCETVCPVAATTHSSEGLNQMTYNRCIGTRYCANNCPYKVRRFNWFNYSDTTDKSREFQGVNYTMNDDLGKMVLNPDVMVRARGTMEKCSMCVQRIQAGKLEAKKAGEKLKDGSVKTACQASCATGAIVFGDMNDPKSQISQIINEENAGRKYHVLEELNVKPNISYLAKIRNV